MAAKMHSARGALLHEPTVTMVEIPIGVTGTLSNLYVTLTTAPGAGQSWVLTVDVNGTATALTCTITNTNTTCSDASLVSVTAGDTVDLDVSPVGSPAVTTRIAESAT